MNISMLFGGEGDLGGDVLKSQLLSFEALMAASCCGYDRRVADQWVVDTGVWN